MVLAPTGVAADNIGGQTYHSVLPMPFKNRRVLTWDGPKKGSDRHKRMVHELENVEWIIIDEMSMIGRRALGLIDKMLKHGTGAHDKDFGGKNMILVGDFGQLPPVGEATMHDTSSVWDPVKKKALDNDSSPFDSTGFLLYRRCFQLGGHVHFLQIIERVPHTHTHAHVHERLPLLLLSTPHTHAHAHVNDQLPFLLLSIPHTHARDQIDCACEAHFLCVQVHPQPKFSPRTLVRWPNRKTRMFDWRVSCSCASGPR